MKKEKAFTGVDVCIAIVAIIVFTSVILSLLYNVRLENLRIKTKAVANVYLIETLENIGILDYDAVTENNVTVFPQMTDVYQGRLSVEKITDTLEDKEDILKRVTVTIAYRVGDKTYEETIQRLKIKE